LLISVAEFIPTKELPEWVAVEDLRVMDKLDELGYSMDGKQSPPTTIDVPYREPHDQCGTGGQKRRVNDQSGKDMDNERGSVQPGHKPGEADGPREASSAPIHSGIDMGSIFDKNGRMPRDGSR
jgi:hypothetical protein